MLEVEIAYGLVDRQELRIVRVEEGTAMRQAALRSPIVKRFPDVDLNTISLGIFGRVVEGDAVLRAHNRIEVYRPSLIGPKDARHKRMQNKKEGRQTA